MNILRNEKGYLGLLGIVITLAIIGILMNIMIKTYFKAPASLKQVDQILNQSEVSTSLDTTNYRTLVNTTRKSIDDINKQHMQQVDDYQRQVQQ